MNGKNTSKTVNAICSLTMSATLAATATISPALAESQLVSPKRVEVLVRGGEVAPRGPAFRSIVNGEDLIQIRDLVGGFQCKRSRDRFAPEVVQWAFNDQEYTPRGPLQEGDTPNNVIRKDTGNSDVIANSIWFLQFCDEKAPQGEKTSYEYPRFLVTLKTMCYSPLRDKPFWEDGKIVSYDRDIWNEQTMDSYHVTIHCDKENIFARVIDLGNGRYKHDCPWGHYIAGTQENSVENSSGTQRTCRAAQRADEIVQESQDGSLYYYYRGPTPGGNLRGLNQGVLGGWDSLSQDEQWCFPPASRRG